MPSSLSHRFLFVLTFVAALSLSGCGGDNSDNSVGPSAANAEPPAAATGSGGLVDFFGSIQSVTSTTLTVEGRTFLVNGETQVLRQGTAVSYGVLTPGETVVVKAKLNRDSAWVAHEIRLRDETPLDPKLTGRVESVSPPTLVVARRLVYTNSGTLFTGKGDPRSLEDVRAGFLVTITGFQGDGGTVTATKIRVEAKS